MIEKDFMKQRQKFHAYKNIEDIKEYIGCEHISRAVCLGEESLTSSCQV